MIVLALLVSVLLDTALRRHLRVSDSIYRDPEGGLLALLAHADARSARGVGERARGQVAVAAFARLQMVRCGGKRDGGGQRGP